ncbi:MAG: cation:proton antiporter [Pseudomonadales bacterium]
MTLHSPALVLGLIAVTGFLCQWLSWRIKLPAILLLLSAGIALGPITGMVNTNELLGDLLFPIVSLCVAIILFEGSLTLEFHEIRAVGDVVRRLVSYGAIITWLCTAVVTRYLFGIDWSLALLFGSLVVVTGPTVIVPMLRTVRPNKKIRNVLRWEGIVIDPLGALLAVVVYEYIVTDASGSPLENSFVAFMRVLVIGGAFGFASGFGLGFLLRRHWVPEFLQNFATIAFVLGTFTLSNQFAHESGLLAVTVMGICLANMRDLHVEDILSFKENLTLLLISALFILLAARIDLQQIKALGWPAFALLASLQLVIRPIGVWISAIGSELNWREKAIISWIGPRGIVAAAISGLFALQLEQLGYLNASILVELTFFIIIGTVLLQSATSRLLAKFLNVVDPDPKGALIIGANHVARAIASALQEKGINVLVSDVQWDNVKQARLAGLPVFYGNPISEYADRNLDLVGLGRLIAASPRREDNVLAAMRYQPEFGRENIFALKTKTEADLSGKKTSISHTYKGAFLGNEDLTFGKLSQWLKQGARIRTTQITEEYNFANFIDQNATKVIPLIAIDKKRHMQIFTDKETVEPKAGWLIISVYKEDSKGVEDKKTDGEES